MKKAMKKEISKIKNVVVIQKSKQIKIKGGNDGDGIIISDVLEF